MRLQWKPGDTMMVDWAGLTLTYTTDGGVRKVLYFFVAVLPYSDLIFACACPDMKIPSWLNGHIRAFEYFGGVTGDVISDNLKAGVTKHAKYELILNESYREFGEHYNVHINPTGVRRPKEKASVERAVRHVTEQIIVKVRDMDLHSFDDINEAVSKLLDNVNSKILSDYNESRYSLYMREEYESMRPLPEVPFEIGTWKSVTVPADYHISVEKNKYSVPYTLIDERVSVRITEENVYVYHEGKLVALHTKAKSKCRNPVTTQAHMHPKHIAYQEKYDPEYIRAWADKEGGRIKQMVTDLLESGRSPKEGVKHCVSLMNLVERHSKEAVEAAYYEAVSAGDKPTLKVVAGIVKKKSAESMQGKNAVPKPSGYSRGAGYYK